MFRASLRPSSGGQTAFHCLCFSVLLYTQLVHTACIPTLQHHNSYNRTENHRQWNAVWPPVDGRKDARNMLRNNWLPVKSLIVASSWSRLYLLIKDARSFEHKTYKYCLFAECNSMSYNTSWLSAWPPLCFKGSLLFKGIIAVYCANQTKYFSTFCGQNAYLYPCSSKR